MITMGLWCTLHFNLVVILHGNREGFVFLELAEACHATRQAHMRPQAFSRSQGDFQVSGDLMQPMAGIQ